MGLFTWLFGTAAAPQVARDERAIMTKAEWLASRDGYKMMLQVSSEQCTPRKHLLLSCGCLTYLLQHNDDPAAVFGPEIFSPASNVPDWLTGAEAAADGGNPSIFDLYASSIPGQKAHWWLGPEALAQVVRDLFVYPFGTVPFCGDWLSTTIVMLAETIDAEKSFDGMPVLGDALEAAGCTDEDVLQHCRQESCHFRGCWVLDSLLRPARRS